jgi:hypothetical protein
MRISVHSRGGMSVYGGDYDPKGDQAYVQARDGETVSLTIEYPSAPTAMTKAQSGISCTTPAIAGSKATATLSGIQDQGYVDIAATVGGERRIVRVRGRSDNETDRYED